MSAPATVKEAKEDAEYVPLEMNFPGIYAIARTGGRGERTCSHD
jgi:hypothetical protein